MKKLLLVTALLAVPLLTNAQDAPKQDPPSGEMRMRGGGQRMERGPGTAGTITAIEGQTIKVKTFNGAEATVKVMDTTKFNKDRQEAKFSDFKVGDNIMVRGEEAGDHTYTAQAVFGGTPGAGGGMMRMMSEGMGKQFIAGKVEKIEELRLTIARVDGQSQVIEVDENTSFKKQGQSITLADIKVGDEVVGRGEVKNDIFVPATLNVGFPPAMRMMMGPGANGGAAPEKQPEHK